MAEPMDLESKEIVVGSTADESGLNTSFQSLANIPIFKSTIPSSESLVIHPDGILFLIHKAESLQSLTPVYTEYEGDMIIWPEEKTYSEDYVPEYFFEAFDDDAITGVTTKDDLITTYKTLIAERARLMAINQQLQMKAMDFLRKKKIVIAEPRATTIRMQVDYDEKYQKYLSVWEGLITTYSGDEKRFIETMSELKTTYVQKLQQYEGEEETFDRLKREHVKRAVHSQTGQKLSPQDAEVLFQKEQTKISEVKATRTANFNLKYRVKKRELAVHSKEGLAGGHHMYDFEQLKIENQAYNEKIEERNEELSKFRRKIINTIQMMAHIKEKVNCLIGENEELQRILAEVENEAARRREQLSRIKQIKDKLREERRRLHQNSGLLGKSAMLRDLRLKQKEANQLKQQLAHLKVHHHEYVTGLQRVTIHLKLAAEC